MNNETRKYDIRLFDQVLTIVSDEPKEHVLYVAKYVEDTMRQISLSKAPDLSVSKIAMLASLQIASQLVKKEEQYRFFEKEILSIDRLLSSADPSI
ncbi:MAG TPA: cell division protein ZapA [Candidatus Babeliales bacterium]|nr:cell division protein ZapA [Candidatus Babeliales bacterium]